MIAPDRKSAAAVIANFRQVAGERELRLHPLIPRLVDVDALERMGAKRMGRDDVGHGAEGDEVPAAPRPSHEEQ